MENFSTEFPNNQIQKSWSDFLASGVEWRGFYTITFRDFHTQFMVEKKIKSLVQILNRDFFGKNYTHYVGHSYFSYVYCLEYQTRGALHVHFLADKPLHYDLAHTICKTWDAFFYGVKVGDERATIEYISKYVSKGGELVIYKSDSEKLPKFLPMWYLASVGLLRRVE
jgi:hypothetical protein